MRLLLATLSVVLLAAPPIAAHQRLVRSQPADSTRLDAVPRELRLTFAQPVELALTRVVLLDPTGSPVALEAPAFAGDSANVVVIGIAGRIVAGEYTVTWRTAGPDGHPVDGRIAFAVAPDAAGLAPPEPEPPPVAESGDPAPAGGDAPAATAAQFGVGSPAYVAIRWLTFLCLVGLIGSVAFPGIVLRIAKRRHGGAIAEVAGPAADRARTIGLVVAALLLPATALRLAAQAQALGGADAGVLRTLLTGTAWGAGWILQAAAAVAALLGFAWARRDARGGWGLAYVAVLALAFTPALSGHAAAADASPVSILADAVHVIGAGGWLGSLALVLGAGMPAALRLGEGRRGAAVAALVDAFSPTALAFAGALVATGLYASWLHVGAVDALLDTAYGRTLLLKLGALSLVFATGAYNFIRLRPSLGDDVGVARIRRTSMVELGVGTIVLIVTAVLVATPPAAEPEAEAAPHAAVEAPARGR